jgi:Flp pilus assembly protein TadD
VVTATLLTTEQIAPPLPGIPADTAPTLIHLWDVTCADCLPELRTLAAAHDALNQAGLRVVLLNAAADDATARFLKDNAIPFPAHTATDETIRRLRRLMELLFGVDLALPVPFGLLLDGTGHAAALYRGPCSIERLLSDVRGLSVKWPARAALTLPFPGQWMDPPGTTNPLTLPGELAERGFLDDALALFQRHLPQCAKQPGCAPVLMALAAAFEKQQRFPGAITTYRLARQADPQFPGALNNLAWHLAACPDASLRRPAEALPLIHEAAALTKHADPEILDTLATVSAANDRWADAEAALGEAIAIARAASRPEAVQRFEASLRRVQQRQR